MNSIKKFVLTICITIILAASCSFSQKQEIFLNIDSISVDLNLNKIGYRITNPIKFSSKDSSIFASPFYDDKQWSTKKLALNLDEFAKEELTGVAWFRINIVVDSSLKNRVISLLVAQNGASDIYFDGKKIETFGTPWLENRDETPYNPINIPIAVYLNDKKEHLLAIRYTYMDALKIYSIAGRLAGEIRMRITLAEQNNYAKAQLKIITLNSMVNLVLFGILFTLTFVYLLIFLYRRTEKTYFLFSFYTLNMALIFLLSYIISVSHYPTFSFLIEVLTYFFLICIFILLLAFLYSAFLPKMPVQFWIFLSSGWSIFLLSTLDQYFVKFPFLGYLFPVYVAASALETLRMIYWSVKKKLEGAKIIGIGALGFILLVAFVFLVNLFQVQRELSESILVIILYTGFISLPFSMAIFLARSISITNKNLELKLEEVKQLSAYTLEQEREATELKIQAEREKAKTLEAELQTKAAEAQSRILQIENDRKAKELDEARTLQLSMLPKEIICPPHLEIDVFMQTATEVGGDYYDFSLADDNSLTIVLGDATGHGVRAGIMVSTVKSLFIHHAHHAPLKMINLFNRSLRAMKFDRLYMCLCAVKITNYKMTIANAGIPPILIHRKVENKIEAITLKSMPLGGFEEFPYKEIDVNLLAGDTVLIMSDGFPELFNDEGEMLDYAGASEVFNQLAHLAPKDIISNLALFVKDWRGGKLPNDDVSFIAIKVKN